MKQNHSTTQLFEEVLPESEAREVGDSNEYDVWHWWICTRSWVSRTCGKVEFVKCSCQAGSMGLGASADVGMEVGVCSWGLPEPPGAS